jgi:capsular polysaccharide biosynthesis protein
MPALRAEDFAAHAKRRSWFIVLQAVLVLLGVVIVLAVRNETTASSTTHFVLHPDRSVPAAEVPQAIDVLEGTLVQTVLRVLNSDEIVQRASAAADVPDREISIDASVHPGSAYYDVTVSGQDRGDVAAISKALPGVASRYVDESYQGYDLETLGTTTATDRSFPPSLAVVTLSLLLGALLGLVLVFIEWLARRLQLVGESPAASPATAAADVAAEPVLEPAPVAEPVPEPAPVAEPASAPVPIAVATTDAADPALVSESTSPLKAVRPNTLTTRTVQPAVEGDLAPPFEPNIALDAERPVPAKRAPARKPRSTKSRASARTGAKTAGTRTRKPRATNGRAAGEGAEPSTASEAADIDIDVAASNDGVLDGGDGADTHEEVAVGARVAPLEPVNGNGHHDANGNGQHNGPFAPPPSERESSPDTSTQ